MKAIAAKLALGVAILAVSVPATAQNRGRAPTPTIAIGQTVEGEISAPTGTCPAPDPRVRVYRFTVPDNSRVEIVMRADDFDTLVELGQMDGCTFNSLGSNDDGSGPEDGLNSRLIANLTTGGEYVIHAKSLNEDGTGKFSLSLNTLPPPPGEPTPVPIAIGETKEGTLDAQDAVIDEGYGDSIIVDSARPYEFYSFTGRAGQEYEITMASDEFDSFLEIGTMSPLGFSVADSNDDGANEEDGLNSRLRVRFRRDGEMVVRVSPLSAATGAFKLTVAEAQPEDAAATEATGD